MTTKMWCRQHAALQHAASPRSVLEGSARANTPHDFPLTKRFGDVVLFLARKRSVQLLAYERQWMLDIVMRLVKKYKTWQEYKIVKVGDIRDVRSQVERDLYHKTSIYIVAYPRPKRHASKKHAAFVAHAREGKGEAECAVTVPPDSKTEEKMPGKPVPVPTVPLPCAYMQLRAVTSNKVRVLYIYELQLEEVVQRRGLGAWMLRAAEREAAAVGIGRLMLTVHVANTAARGLYEKSGFKTHKSSPEAREYMILYKDIGASL